MSKNKFDILHKWICNAPIKKDENGTVIIPSVKIGDNEYKSIEDVCNELLATPEDLEALGRFFEEKEGAKKRTFWYTRDKKSLYDEIIRIKEQKEKAFKKDNSNVADDFMLGNNPKATANPDQHDPIVTPNGDDVVVENQPDDENKNKRPDLLKYLEEAWEKREVKFEPLFPKDHFEYPYGYNLGTEDAEKDQPTGRATLKEKNHLVLESNDLTQFVATMEGIKNAGHNSISLNLKGTDEEKKAFAAKAIVAGMIAGVEIKDFPYDLKELKQFDERIEKVMRIEEAKKSISNATVDTKDAKIEESINHAIEESINHAYDAYTQVVTGFIRPEDQLKIFKCGVEAAKHSKHQELANKVLQQRQAATTRS